MGLVELVEVMEKLLISSFHIYVGTFYPESKYENIAAEFHHQVGMATAYGHFTGNGPPTIKIRCSKAIRISCLAIS